MASIQQILANAAAAAGIPFALFLAQARQESGLNPNAYNRSSGATGLLQLTPATAADLGVANPLDPAQNAQGGARYLSQMHQQFGDWAQALAAYNWGPTRVANAIAQWGGDWLSHAPAETRNYVTSILDAAGMGLVTASLTPASIVTGAVDLVTGATSAPPADAAVAASGPSPGPSIGQILALTGLAFGAYLLAVDLS